MVFFWLRVDFLIIKWYFIRRIKKLILFLDCFFVREREIIRRDFFIYFRFVFLGVCVCVVFYVCVFTFKVEMESWVVKLLVSVVF